MRYLLLFGLLGFAAYAGTNTLPIETAKVIQRAHVNKFQDALTGDLVPRSVPTGAPIDQSGSLGSTSYGWQNIYIKALKFMGVAGGYSGATTITIAMPSPLPTASYTMTLPNALPTVTSAMGITTAGQIQYGLTGTVQTSDLADGAVTYPKRSALNYQISSSDSGTFSTNSGADQQVSNLSVTITTTGRPVFVGAIGSTGNTSLWTVFDPYANKLSIDSAALIKRDGTKIAEYSMSITNASAYQTAQSVPTSTVWAFDVPSAGIHTYILYVRNTTAGCYTNFRYANLVAYEL